MFYITKISKLIIPIILINSLIVLSSEYYQSFAQEQSSESEIVDANEIMLSDSILDTISQVAHQKTISYLKEEEEEQEIALRFLELGIIGRNLGRWNGVGVIQQQAVNTPSSRKLIDCQEYVKRLQEDLKLSKKTIQYLNSHCPFDICSKEAKAWYSFVVEEVEKKINNSRGK